MHKTREPRGDYPRSSTINDLFLGRVAGLTHTKKNSYTILGKISSMASTYLYKIIDDKKKKKIFEKFQILNKKIISC